MPTYRCKTCRRSCGYEGKPPPGKTGKPTAEAALWFARIYSRQKKHDDTIRVLKDLLPRYPNDPLRPDLLFDQANLQNYFVAR